MRVVGRLVKLLLFVGIVGSVAAATFLLVRHQPRVTILGPWIVQKLSADGTRLITSVCADDKRVKGPLQIWDTHSGTLICRLLGNAPLLALKWSPDGRHAAAVPADESLHILDLRAGEKWQIDGIRPRIDDWHPLENLHFSPKGKWLSVRNHDWQTTIVTNFTRPTIVRKIHGSFRGFAGNEEYVFTDIRHHWGPGVMQLESGKAVGEGWSMGGTLVGSSPDGSMIVFDSARWDSDDKEHKRPIGQTEIWNSELVLTPLPSPLPPNATKDQEYFYNWAKEFRHRAHFEKRLTIEHPANEPVIDREYHRRQHLFSPDSRYLASWMDKYPREEPLEIFDTQKGKRLASLSVKKVSQVGFSVDASLLWVAESDRLVVLEVATGQILWSTPRFGSVQFCSAAGAFLCRTADFRPWEIFDAGTGVRRASVSPQFATQEHTPQLTNDGRRFAIAGCKVRGRPPTDLEAWLESWQPEIFGDGIPGVVVLDATTGTELFRVLNRGIQSLLSDNGETLVTVENDLDTSIIRVWDVDPHRAWTSAAVAGLCAALSLWFVIRTWHWGRRRATSVSQAA